MQGSDSRSFGSDSNESGSDDRAKSRQHDNLQSSGNIPNQNNYGSPMKSDESAEVLGDDPAETGLGPKLTDKNSTISNGPVHGARRAAVWGRTPAKKKLSMESIDFPFEDDSDSLLSYTFSVHFFISPTHFPEASMPQGALVNEERPAFLLKFMSPFSSSKFRAEIERLEATKIDLQNTIAEEAKENAVLQESLERRKNALHERRLALEQEVTRLQGQLNKERELRKVLEAGLEMPQGSILLSASIDEKTKAELEEIVRVEADVTNLKQTADDIGMQLNQQRELNSGFAHGSCSQARLRERGKEIETTDTFHTTEKSTRSKDNQLDKVDSDKDMKQDLPFYSNKQLPQKQMMDPARNSKSVGVTATSSSASSKKFGARDEGANNSTSSALSKLTNRLNFLKERRGQIANELQNMDKGRSSGTSVKSFERGSGLDWRHSVQNPDKFHGTIDNQSVYNSQKGLEIRSNHSPQIYENTERVGMTDGGSLQHLDKGIMEGQFAPNLERGKSESFPNVDKGRRSDGHPHVPPRTYSR
ncbi:hypothetical protein RHSIM_Rhsim07G0210700 [Rhododendron simsii]|uniref:Ternary complex factor MIP1 leucine-zipper domain-containing protein n=1 Tax=Rhododendron simsii TaxID=118357 RepID=A0A834LJB1_RHOSS|nr:hypothetical protein RHSIM_Rhsim07G0210700 [Rhododendron simsii]